MKDLSFTIFKNSIGSKMRKGIGTLCNGDGATSTLDQGSDLAKRSTGNLSTLAPPTLEDLILQLQLEEEMATKAKIHDYRLMDGDMRGRMSSVNNSDILRSARNALNQYPRFSLDGKDAMYRSSFRNFDDREILGGRKSTGSDSNLRKGRFRVGMDRFSHLPSTLGGEFVVWRKPGVVAKLMGLEVMPEPVITAKVSKERLMAIMKRQNLRTRAQRHEMERRALAINLRRCHASTIPDALRQPA